MNRSRTGRQAGLTLIEVLIALVVLAIGIFALVQLQALSLRSTADAQAMNRTTRLVRNELEFQRQTALAPGATTCSSTIPDDFEQCAVEIEQCALDFDASGGSDLVCGDTVTPSTYRITVSATGPRNQALTLS